MDKKQVLIITLLVVAVVVSSISIALNFNLVTPFRQVISANAISPNGNIQLTVLKNDSVEVLNDGTG